jgi:hypothetical protein
MKKNILNTLALATVLGSALFLMDGCKVKNPVEGVKVIVLADALSAPFEFYVADAATGAQADLGLKYEVKVTGPDAGLVYTSGGSKTIVVNQGLLQFAFKKGVEPSESNPIRFNFEFTGTKYQDLIFPVEITSLDQLNTTISLVNFDNPPVGATSLTKTVTTGTDGKTSANETLVLASAPSKPDAARVLLKSGTQLLDASGSPVSGAIETKIIHSTPTETSLESFPGGLELNELVDKSGAPVEGGDIEPIGWVDFEMKAGSKEVKTFSQPVEVTMEISDSLINPDTELPYQAGEKLAVLSLSKGTNIWVNESEATIVKNNTSGKLEVTMQVNHLSKWTTSLIKKKCGERFRFKTSNNSKKKVKIKMTVRLSSKNSKVYSQNITLPAKRKSSSFTTSFKPSAKVKYNLEFKNASKTRKYNNKVLCNGEEIEHPEDNPDAKENQFNIMIKCSNGNQVILPDGYSLYYIKESEYQANIVPTNGNTSAHKIDPADGIFNGVSWTNGSIILEKAEDGITSLNAMNFKEGELIEGEKYRFSVYYNGSREDYLTDPYNKAIMDIPGGYSITITVRECPL